MIGRRWWVPWVWMAPALLLFGAFLVYPSIDTFWPSGICTSMSAAIVSCARSISPLMLILLAGPSITAGVVVVTTPRSNARLAVIESKV